jgi:hypothetical protein
LSVKQALELFTLSFSFSYATTSYGCCFSCYSCSTKVEKEEEVATTQEHNKSTNKRNQKNSKSGRRKIGNNLSFSTLSDKEQIFLN